MCVCVHVHMFHFLIYIFLLHLTHELAVERLKALRRQGSYVTFSRGCLNLGLTARTHSGYGEVRVFVVLQLNEGRFL